MIRSIAYALPLIAVGTAAFAPTSYSAVPAPLAGATGPLGLAAAAVAYGAYRLVKWKRNK